MCESVAVTGFYCPLQSKMPVFAVGDVSRFETFCSFHSNCKLQRDFQISEAFLSKEGVEK